MAGNQNYMANPDFSQITQGTPVYDANGDKIGSVDDVRNDTLVVQKGLIFTKDLPVPLRAVRSASAEGVYLDVTKDQVEHQDWSALRAAPNANMGQPAMTSRDDIPRGARGTRGDIDVPLAQEELVANKERGQIGDVHVAKDVVSTQQTVSTPVTREEVSVDRQAVNKPISADDDAFQQREFDVPVMGEQVNFGKEARVTEEVRLHKDEVTEQEQATDTVRRERLRVEGDDDILERDNPRQ